jgi:hypothetical protein
VSKHLDTLKALETQGFTTEELRFRFLSELRLLSDAYTQQLLRFGRDAAEGEGVLYSIMVAQAYCISRLMDLNEKLTLSDALERYAEIELEAYATPASVESDRARYRNLSLRCEAQELHVDDSVFFKLYSPIDQRSKDYLRIPANSWFQSGRRTLPRVIDFILKGLAVDPT